MRLGFHMPLSGSVNKQLERASELGMETVQIFTGNPTSWKPGKIDYKTIDKFNKKQTELNIKPLVFHTPYLINMASPKEDVREKSLLLLQNALEKAHAYNAPYVVTHVGSHVGQGLDPGIASVCRILEKLMPEWPSGVTLLLENTSGSGNTLGGEFKELGKIISEMSNPQELGCCFDTAHAWGAGYDISNKSGVDAAVEELAEEVGLNRVKVCHANDTSVELGSTKDRHDHIGEGRIAEAGFSALLNHLKFNPEAVIMETPEIGTEADGRNLERLRKAVS